MADRGQTDAPITRISLDQLKGREREREKERKEAAKAEEKQRKAEEKEQRKASGSGSGSGSGGFSRLFKRSPSRGKADEPVVSSTAEGKKPAGLTIGTEDANRLRPGSALEPGRPGSAQSQRSLGGSSSLLSPNDRQPKTPKSPSLWERPTRSREGDVGFEDE